MLMLLDVKEGGRGGEGGCCFFCTLLVIDRTLLLA